MITLALPRLRSWSYLPAWALDLCLVGLGVLVMAGLSQLVVPLPFTPVPLTMQTLGALLVGGALGWRRAAASMAAYLAIGAAGAPVFAQGTSGLHTLVGANPSAGYLWGMALAAVIVGRLGDRGRLTSFRSTIGAMLLGEVATYAIGLPWLALTVHVSLLSAVTIGLAPFVVGDAIKLLLAAGALPAAWRLIRRFVS